MLTLCIDLSKPQADAWLITHGDSLTATEKLCSFDNPLTVIPAPIEPVLLDASTEAITDVAIEAAPPEPPKLPGLLLDAVSPHRARLDRILVITDGSHILSRAVKLPFADPKRVAQLLLPEVADQVPFELDTFVVAPGLPSPISQGFLFPILVIENSKLEALLALLQTASLNANEIILPSTVIAVSTESLLATATASLIQSGEYVYVRLLTPARSLQRIIPFQNPQRVLQELRQTLLFFERESGVTLQRLDAHCDAALRQLLESNLPKQFEQQYNEAPLIDFVSEALKKNQPLENLRVGKYSYHVKLGGLLKSFSGTLPYAALGVVLMLFGIFGYSVSRSNATEDLQSASASAIKKAAPELATTADSDVLTALQDKNKDLDQQLQTLGSPSKFSPLAVLRDVSTDFPSSDSITISGLRISGDELTLDGSAPDYTGIEKLDRALKAKRTTFCRVSKNVSNSAQGRGAQSRGFTFTIKLCD